MDNVLYFINFFQEWGALIALLFFIALVAISDVIPKLGAFIHEVERRYPQAVDLIFDREQYVIDCYERLPVRLIIGFSLIGGKRAWAWLVKAGFAYLKRKQNT